MARRTASALRSTRNAARPSVGRLRIVEALGTGEQGRYITELTFANAHGVYKPGSIKLRPEVFKDVQQ